MSLTQKIFNIFNIPHKLNAGVDIGDQNRPTIILLHGIASSSSAWTKMVEALGDDYRVIALDLLGFGKSPKPLLGKYDINDHVRSVRRTLKKLNIRRPYAIIGHSMGSIIALNYASKYQKEMSHLYLMSIPVYQKDAINNNKNTDKKIDTYCRLYQLLIDNKKFTISVAKKLAAVLGDEFGFEINEDNWHSFRESLIETIIKQDTVGSLSKVKIPVDVIYGSLDTLLVKDRVDSLGQFKNVRITRLPFITHVIDSRFVKATVHIIKH